MSKRIYTSVVFLLLSLFLIQAQNYPKSTVVAFQKGDAKLLQPLVGEEVALHLLNQKVLTPQKVIASLGEFFKENPVLSFELKNEGERAESSYFIGSLTTKTGVYRVNCFFKRIENNIVIHQIRIDKANGQVNR